MIQTAQQQQQAELRERAEHQDVLKNLRIILSTPQGKDFVKYLFKSFSVGEFPPVGVPEEFLREEIGFLRSGNAIFKIISEANAEVAGSLLAQIEKEKHVQAYNDQVQQG